MKPWFAIFLICSSVRQSWSNHVSLIQVSKAKKLLSTLGGNVSEDALTLLLRTSKSLFDHTSTKIEPSKKSKTKKLRKKKDKEEEEYEVPMYIPQTYYQQVITLPHPKMSKHELASVPKEPVSKTDICQCSHGSEFASGRKDAIVYTVKDAKRFLDKSLTLLYQNFNHCYRKDVLIFHNGGITNIEQEQMRKKHGPEIQFHVLENGQWWQFPKGLNTKKRKNWVQYPRLGVGYRHMMRWYSVLIYDYLANLGYQWYMRLDDDSYILSCLSYDPFAFLEDNGHEYGYRMATFDDKSVAVGLAEIAKQYLEENKMEPSHQLLAHFKNGNISTSNWDVMGHYSNFLISKISFWKSPPVQKWLRAVDSSGIQYTKRVGDLLVQSMTLLMFMPSTKIYRFTDWAYAHFTLATEGYCIWGGLVTAKNQPTAQATVMLDWAYYRLGANWALESEAGERMVFCSYMVLPMADYDGF